MSLPFEFVEYTRQQTLGPIEKMPSLVFPDMSLSLAVISLSDYSGLLKLVENRLNLIANRLSLLDSPVSFEFKKPPSFSLKILPVKTSKIPKLTQDLETKLAHLVGKTDNLSTDLKTKSRDSKDQLESLNELAAKLATNITDKNTIKAEIYAINPTTLESTLNKHWTMIAQLDQDLTPVLVQADVEKVQHYFDLVYAFYTELVDTYYDVYNEFQILTLKHEGLAQRLSILVDKCNDTYVNMLNAAYIRSGEYIRVRKEADKIYVSAWKPTPAPCEKAQPIWKKSEVVVKDNPATCPPPPDKTNPKDCDYIIEVSEDENCDYIIEVSD